MNNKTIDTDKPRQKSPKNGLPEGWEMKELGEVCEITHGFAFSGKDFEADYYGEKPIVLTPGNFTENSTLIFNEKNTKRCRCDYPKKFEFNIGDLVVVMTDLSSKMKILGKPSIIEYENILHNQRIGRFIFSENLIEKRFLYFFLQTDSYLKMIKKSATGTMVRHTAPKRILAIPIPIPPLLEQKRIVGILDQAFAAIDKAEANAEQNLKNAKELFESYLQGIVSNGNKWEKKTLAQISTTFGRGKSKHRPRNWEGLYGGKYPFIQTGDIRNCNHFITEYSQTYNEVGFAQSKLWPAGTICITIAANIAETGILTFDSCFPDSVIGIVVNKKLADRDFVEYLLQSFKVRIQSLGKGSAQANINMGTFENELFPFPPVKEQKLIVERLNQLAIECNKLEDIYIKKSNNLEELKKSILQKAFAGGL